MNFVFLDTLSFSLASSTSNGCYFSSSSLLTVSFAYSTKMAKGWFSVFLNILTPSSCMDKSRSLSLFIPYTLSSMLYPSFFLSKNGSLASYTPSIVLTSLTSEWYFYDEVWLDKIAIICFLIYLSCNSWSEVKSLLNIDSELLFLKELFWILLIICSMSSIVWILSVQISSVLL